MLTFLQNLSLDILTTVILIKKKYVISLLWPLKFLERPLIGGEKG